MIIKLQWVSFWFLVIVSLLLLVVSLVALGFEYKRLGPALFSVDMLLLLKGFLEAMILAGFGLLFAWWMLPQRRYQRRD